jgi:hypothetical protein
VPQGFGERTSTRSFSSTQPALPHVIPRTLLRNTAPSYDARKFHTEDQPQIWRFLAGTVVARSTGEQGKLAGAPALAEFAGPAACQTRSIALLLTLMAGFQAGAVCALEPVGHSTRRAGRIVSAVRFALWIIACAAVAGLVVLHAAIFWSHLDSGRLMEPLTAGRWLISFCLVGFLVVLRRRGVPLFRGRRALVVWMLVVLLHWTAGAPAQPATIDAPHATGILFLLPATAAPLIAAAAALLLIAFSTAQAAAARRVWDVVPPARIGRTRSCCSRRLVPRAPPLSIA